MLLAVVVVGKPTSGRADDSQTALQSPDGRNSIVLKAADNDRDHVRFTISRDGQKLIGPSPLGPVLAVAGPLGDGARIVDVKRGDVDERFQLPWGKTSTVVNRCSKILVTLATPSDLRWEVELSRGHEAGLTGGLSKLR